MPVVDAIVTAGGVPEPGDPLYAYTQGSAKALLQIAGQPMIQWVLDALSGAHTVRRVVVAGTMEAAAPLRCSKTLGFLPGQGSMIDNIRAGVQWITAQDPSARFALIVSSDIPTITPEVVNWKVETCLQTDHDAYYSVVPQQAMERRFPGSKRSYFRFKDGQFTGGDLVIIACSLVTNYHPAWHAIVEARKSIFKQARLIGLDTLLLLATRQLSLARAQKVVSQRLRLRGRVLICPYAEAGMDVDKPAQYELIKRDLEARASPPNAQSA